MLEQLPIENVLFLDIETVPQWPDFESVPHAFKALWEKKFKYLQHNENDTAESLFQRAGIYAEFGKVICISTGFFAGEEFRIKSFYGDDEAEVLENFGRLLRRYFNTNEHYLCAHNGREFDFPYISRRMLVNRIHLPPLLDIAGRKPWEVRHLDTMQLWKFGDYKNYTSLALLAALFNIPTPKDDIDGSQVAGVYYQDRNLERIRHYCEKDTLTVAQLLLAYRNQKLLEKDQIVIIE